MVRKNNHLIDYKYRNWKKIKSKFIYYISFKSIDKRWFKSKKYKLKAFDYFLLMIKIEKKGYFVNWGIRTLALLQNSTWSYRLGPLGHLSSIILLWKINWVNSEFSYSCSTATTARGFHGSMGKIPFHLSGRIQYFFFFY